MSACLTASALAELVTGRLSSEVAAVAQHHLDACEACFRMVVEAARSTIHGGGPAPPPSGDAAPGVPRQIEEYRILRRVGQGGMGQVFLGLDTRLDRQVAIKLLGIETRAAARERFLIEARAVARLSHPNVVTIYRVGEIGERPYLVQEFVPGVSLDALAKPIPWPRALDMALGLARGLAAAHRAGVLHRDIKPANAILSDGGTVKLLDFGLAKLVGPGTPDPDAGSTDARSDGSAAAELPVGSLTRTGAVLGTPLYMPPEAWVGGPATASMDLYSLGATVYELCTAVRANVGTTIDEIRQSATARSVTPLASAVPDIDARFAAAIDRCLQPDPLQRWGSAEELCLQLEQALPLVSRPSARAGRVVRGATLVAAFSTLVVASIAMVSSRDATHEAAKLARETAPDARLLDNDGSGVREGGDEPALFWYDSDSGELLAWRLNGTQVIGTQGLSWKCRSSDGCSSQWTPIETRQHRIIWNDPGGGTVEAWHFDWKGFVSKDPPLSWSCAAASGCSQRWRPIGHAWLRDPSCPSGSVCSAQAFLWHDPLTGEVIVWDLAEDGITVVRQRSLSQQCGAVDGCSRRWQLASTADFDADGESDLLWYDRETGILRAWLLQGAIVTREQDLSRTCDRASGCAQAWRIVGAADVNGDGRTDLTWHNAATGEVSSWLLDGRGAVTGTVAFSWTCGGACSARWKAIGYGRFPRGRALDFEHTQAHAGGGLGMATPAPR